MTFPGNSNSSADIILNDLFKLKTWEDFFLRAPCVKKSYLWGFACSGLMMAHKLRLYRGNSHHAINAGVLTFLTVSSVSFIVCTHEFNIRYSMIKNAFKSNNAIKEDFKKN